MSTRSLRWPESLHESAKALAARERVSINQLVASALAEKASALMAARRILAGGHHGGSEEVSQGDAEGDLNSS